MQNTLFDIAKHEKPHSPCGQVEPFVMLRGDCLEEMPKLENNSVDLLLTDPPYFLPATHYNVRSGSFRSLSDLGILEHYFYSVFKELDRILKTDGHAYIFCDGQSYPVMYATAYPFFKKLRPLIWDTNKQV